MRNNELMEHLNNNNNELAKHMESMSTEEKQLYIKEKFGCYVSPFNIEKVLQLRDYKL